MALQGEHTTRKRYHSLDASRETVCSDPIPPPGAEIDDLRVFTARSNLRSQCNKVAVYERIAFLESERLDLMNQIRVMRSCV